MDSDDERMIVEQCVRARMPFPQFIKDAPTLEPCLGLFFNAFMDLTSCRTMGYGPGPIPWITIAQYCDVHGIDGELRDDVLYHVPRLDKVYLDWARKKATSKKPAEQTPKMRGGQKR